MKEKKEFLDTCQKNLLKTQADSKEQMELEKKDNRKREKLKRKFMDDTNEEKNNDTFHEPYDPSQESQMWTLFFDSLIYEPSPHEIRSSGGGMNRNNPPPPRDPSPRRFLSSREKSALNNLSQENLSALDNLSQENFRLNSRVESLEASRENTPSIRKDLKLENQMLRKDFKKWKQKLMS